MFRKFPGAFSACAIWLSAGAVLAAPPANVAQVLSHSQRIYRSVQGTGCSTAGVTQTCMTVLALKEGDWAGSYTQTRVEVIEAYTSDTGNGTRIVTCPMDETRLQVAQKWARLSDVVDTTSPDCTHFGEKVIFDPFSVEPWSFSGTLTIEGHWLNPGMQFNQNGITVQTDNVAGTQIKENCQYSGAWQMLGGGFSVQGEFHAFGPDSTNGDFSSNHCNAIQK